MANRYWVGGTGTWDGTAGSKWASTSGGTTYTNIPVGGVSGDVVRFDNNSGTSAAGTVITIDNAATCLQFIVVSTFTGTIKFPANTAITVWNSVVLSDSYTTEGVPYIKLNATTSRTIQTGGTIDSGSEGRSFTFEITNGGSSVTISGGVSFYVRSIIFSNSSGNNTFSFGVPSTSFVIYGDLIFNNLVTSLVGTTTKTFAGTVASIQKISSPLTLDFPITFSGTSTYQLQSNLTISNGVSLRTITHTSGTIDLQSYTLSHYGNYTSGGSTSTRSIAGTGVYNITRSGLATYWDCANATGFTRSGTVSVQFTASTSTLTVLHGTTGGAEANAMSFFFGSSPTVVLATTNKIADLGVLPSSSVNISGTTTARTIYGGFFGGSTTTQSSNPFGPLTFASTSATARNINITSSSHELIFDGVGGSWQLSGTSSAPKVTLTNGTFSTNGNSLTVTTFDFTTTGTRTLNINTTLTINFGGIFKGISTGTTLNNTGTISGSAYTVDVPNLNIGNVATTTSITIGTSAPSGGYTINNLTAPSGGGGTITLYAGSTLNIAGNLSIDGASGSTNTLQSSTSGTQATISKSSGTIITNNLNIVDSYATGGAVWRAPTNYGNINSGNNTNWIFTPIGGGGGNFLMFF
jgi:hypothetical protein